MLGGRWTRAGAAVRPPPAWLVRATVTVTRSVRLVWCVEIITADR